MLLDALSLVGRLSRSLPFPFVVVVVVVVVVAAVVVFRFCFVLFCFFAFRFFFRVRFPFVSGRPSAGASVVSTLTRSPYGGAQHKPTHVHRKEPSRTH